MNLSLFIFEKVMFVMCEKWVETRTDCYIDPSSSLDHSSTSFASWLGLLHRGSPRAQSPLSAAGSHFGILFSNWLKPTGHLVILFSNAHLLPLFFRLFTQVHLLSDSSVEGQYITQILTVPWFKDFRFSTSALLYQHQALFMHFSYLHFFYIYIYILVVKEWVL